jgi:hypothetical protein
MDDRLALPVLWSCPRQAHLEIGRLERFAWSWNRLALINRWYNGGSCPANVWVSMYRFLRPSSLVPISVALAFSAALVVIWPGLTQSRTQVLPLAGEDQEIAWLYAATNSAPWVRFVAAARHARQRLARLETPLNLEIDETNAFPAQTTAVPELMLAVPAVKGSLRVRWYKLTSEQKTADWVKALLERPRPPLAVVGGSSSDLGIELAQSLATRHGPEPAAPLLLLTTATAETVEEDSGERPLNSLYPGRTFRFCFTNRRMAEVVAHFIWAKKELRPDNDPLYLTYWKDDPYSADLTKRFQDALAGPAGRSAARDWAGLAGFSLTGGVPVPVNNLPWGHFRLTMPESSVIPYSVGTFDRPNRWETEAADFLMGQKLRLNPKQQRPLLILPGAAGPARRFLRALVRASPIEARRFVVATGDAIPFNTIYRDRTVAWPIQDLPFSLVLFCHRNPVDSSAGFQAEGNSPLAEQDESAHTGTDDLLLFADLIEAVSLASFEPPQLAANAERLGEHMRRLRWSTAVNGLGYGIEGRPLFDDQGDRNNGTGEHVVYLRPSIHDYEVEPEASLEVWRWQADNEPGRRWIPSATLHLDYEGAVKRDSE